MAQQDQQIIGPSEIPLETSIEVSWNSSPTSTELWVSAIRKGTPYGSFCVTVGCRKQ